MVVCFSLAAEPGFEPRMTESEAGVLPLHYSAELQLQPFTLVYFITIESVCQYLFPNLYKKYKNFFFSP